MASVLDLVKHYQHAIEKYPNDEQKVLKSIDKLFGLGVTVQHLQETGVGRTVNALRKDPGTVGQAARALVNKWKCMVASEESDQEADQNNDTTNYNGHGNGKDSDDSANRSRTGHNDDSKRSSKSDRSRMNGDTSGTKRKYHSSEEEDSSTKKSKHSSSNESSNQKRTVKVKQEQSESDDQHDSEDSQSSDSESEMSESSDDRDHRNTHQKIKIEPSENHKSSPTKHSSHNHTVEPKKELSSTKKSDNDRHSKSHSSDSRHSNKSLSREKSQSSDDHKSSREKESSSEKKHKSDHSNEKEKTRENSSSKPRSSEKHKSSSEKHSHSSEKHSSSESHKSSSQKDKSDRSKEKHEKRESKSDKHSSQSHKSDKDKHNSSSKSDKEPQKHKSRESSSSKEKHNSSSSEKSKDRSSSSKEKSSHSHKSEKKSSSHESKSKSDGKDKNKDERSSEKKSKHNSSSSSSHKSEKSSSKVPKTKPQLNSVVDSDDGIDCGSGASFAEALGMASPVKPKKKTISLKEMSSPNTFNNDLSPAALLAPSAKLAPLPALEISALPEISPNYRPRPPPRLMPHFTDEDAMCQVISSKNQRTKVYSGNKVIGKIPTLYELCVHVLQEHIDALEFTGGVPYEILKPIVDKATPQQLYMLEYHNPYLTEDTDHLWKGFCEKHFRNKKRQEMEAWREMYMRCQEEQEDKLKSLTANIRMTQEAKKAPIKQTKMAYVDSVVKPPRNIARKQAQHGTAFAASASPAARVAALAAAPNVLRGGRAPSAPAPVLAGGGGGAPFKPKKAPLMAKALQFMRGRKR